MAGRRQIGVDIDVDANTGELDTAATSARAFDDELQRLERTERRQEQAAKRAEKATEELAKAQREAAEASEKLARGEITAEQAAERHEHAMKLEERQARATAAANLAAARAVDEHAQQQRQLARDAALAAAAQQLAQMRTSGDVEGHNRLIGELEGRFGDLGRSGGRAFTRIGDSASDAGAKMAKSGGPYTMALAIGAAIGALPAIGALAGLALVSAVGGGLTAIGLKASMSSQRAQDALGRLKDSATTVAKAIGKPWEQTWETIGDVGVDVLNRVSRPLQEIGRGLAPTVSNFIRDLGRSFSELGPFVQAANVGFQRFLRSLGDRLPGMMASLNGSLSQLANSFANNADEIAQFVTGLVQVIGYLARLAAGLTDAFGGMVRMINGVKDLRGTFEGWGQSLGLARKNLADINATAVGTGTAVLGLEVAMLGAKTSATGTGAATSTMKSAMELARQSADQLKSSLDALTGKELTAREAAAAYGQAVLNLNQSLKTNGAAHGYATAKGIANEQALTQLSRASLANVEAMKRNGASAKTVANAMEQARQRIYAAAIRMGYSKQQADRMATSLAGVTRRANAIPRSRTITVKANTAAANAALQHTKSLAGQVGAALGAVTFAAGKKDGGLIKGYASGGQVQKYPTGGMVTGPGGPRADKVPIMASAGEFVVNAAATARNRPLLEAINSGSTSTATPVAGGRSSASGSAHVTIDIVGADADLVRRIKRHVRVKGRGNVQVAFG